jgi:hypothetical protein
VVEARVVGQARWRSSQRSKGDAQVSAFFSRRGDFSLSRKRHDTLGACLQTFSEYQCDVIVLLLWTELEDLVDDIVERDSGRGLAMAT